MSFLDYKGLAGRIHPELDSSGTKTGRFSCKNPNLQQLSDDDEKTCAFPVRRAFIPTPGSRFVSIDYRQQELRLLADLAGETRLCNNINSGMDPHDATALEVGVTRRQAKDINFGILYGMGIDSLAKKLGVSNKEAYELRRMYYGRLPRIKIFTERVRELAERRGWVKAPSGRVFHFPDRKKAYRAVNAIIQGGAADITKRAITLTSARLVDRKSRLLLPVHDELIFEDFGDLDITGVQSLMVQAYDHRLLPMDTSVAIGHENLHDLT